jgi:hypothetical protein
LARRRVHFVVVAGFILLAGVFTFSQTQTTGRIAGTVKDAQGAVIAGAEVIIENSATADKHSLTTDDSGSYSILQLSPAYYDVNIRAPGFNAAVFHSVAVGLGETTTINVTLSIAQSSVEITVTEAPPLIRTDSSELGATLDSRSVNTLPLPTRNILQLLTTAPGVSAPLTNNSAIGRNSPNVSVDGARVTQNSYQINGVDANNIAMHDFGDVAVPAPESVSEVKLQTSMYDASVGGAGGGTVQVVTKSGSNSRHGGAYEYLRNEAFNANDPNLKAVNLRRPVMRRNVYGVALGGPVRKSKAFFFVSYQGTREANGATDQSLYKDVLIDPRLTNDRSAATLLNTYASAGVTNIDPVALALLNFKLPGGQFLIPTPQTPDGRVTGSATSTYHEEQFNANLDYRPNSRDSLTTKFFFANAPLFNALGGAQFDTGSGLPGFGTDVNVDNRVLSLEEIHSFSNTAVNQIRFGYNLTTRNELPREPFRDADLGVQRITAPTNPGLPLIIVAGFGSGAIGTPGISLQASSPSTSFFDALSLQRGKHHVRLGGEIRHSEWRVPRINVGSYGIVEFNTFEKFLSGISDFSDLSTGLPHRDFLTTDYHLFLQDDWKVSSKLTVNLGLRYELDPPAYETKGRIGGFDPALYRPNFTVDSNGFPVGPPSSGVVEAGNAPSQYSVPGVTRVGKRVLKSLDPNNFGPRVGVAWSPLNSRRLALHAGYGVFYSRPSFFYLGLDYFSPPFFFDDVSSGQPIENPFPNTPPENSFPFLPMGPLLSGSILDRNNRTPYFQHFNSSVQYELIRDTVLQVAYVGSRGVGLFRTTSINQARIASLKHPIVNVVTGQTITDNTFENAPLRAPMQGVDPWLFNLNQSTAQSTYHSLQATLNRRFSRGLQFSAAYTFSKSIDNGSGAGGGAFSDGSLDLGAGLDTSSTIGNQLNPRANRGLSDFDRTHYFVVSYVWDVPEPEFAHAAATMHCLLSNWELSGIVTVMSGLPIDIFDLSGGSLYGQIGARPSWASGANRATAMTNVAHGYYFNPSAFAQALVPAGSAIPSAHDSTALAGEDGTDIGDVSRNVLRGPRQQNVDFSVMKRFPLSESRNLEFRADLFNIFNHANRDNPVSDITRSDFGRDLAFSSSPRIAQFALKLSF